MQFEVNMQDRKVRVNWTISNSVVEAIKLKAQQMSLETGIKISESAVADKFLRQIVEEEKVNGKQN